MRITADRPWQSHWDRLMRATLISLMCWSATSGAAVDNHEITRVAQQHFQEGGPGFAIGIYQSGETLYKAAFGTADFGHGTSITTSTRFHIASVSKHFTAFAIALLADDGLLEIDDRIGKYLSYVPEFASDVRIRDLIHHTSGLRDQWLLLNMSGQTFTDHLTNEEIIALVAAQKSLNFPPGTDYAYSNTGYTLLAEIVAVVSGKSFAEFVEERVFRPLGMTGSLFYDDISHTIEGRALSYAAGEEPGTWRHVRLNYETVGATSMFTTVEDMLKWADNFIYPQVGDSSLMNRMLSATRLKDGRELRYGFGLRHESIGGHDVWSHGGADAAFRATFAVVPSREFAVVILANTPTDRIALLRHIIDAYLNDGERVAVAEYPTEVPFDTDTAKRLTGSYLTINERMITFSIDNGRLYFEQAGTERSVVTFRDDGTIDLGFPARYWSYFRVSGEHAGRATMIERVDPTDPSSTHVQFERFDSSSAAQPSLRELSGMYVSDELDASYELTVCDGVLYGRSFLSTEYDRFHHVLGDRFDSAATYMGTIEFVRSRAGKVTGLNVLRRRVNTIPFRRRSSTTVGVVGSGLLSAERDPRCVMRDSVRLAN